MKEKLTKAASSYNKYRKVKVDILRVEKDKFIAKFTGKNLCYTCCLYDWFEDLIYEIGDDKVKFSTSKVEKISDSEYHVEFFLEARW
ncbi:MAG: hypothetical protein DRJ38_10025 [Thermoprotei archaeon]|nr:MAG: hypothetical protein DRJ38_10025 [Thermoprotei archaeon]